MQFKAYEFIVLGVLIDMYFMPIRLIPVYTISFVGAYIIVEVIKPRLKSGAHILWNSVQKKSSL